MAMVLSDKRLSLSLSAGDNGKAHTSTRLPQRRHLQLTCT